MTPQTRSAAPTFCRFCIASCGLLVDVVDNRVRRVRGDPSDPVSAGYCCGTGRALAAVESGPDRLVEASMRIGGDDVKRTASPEDVLDDLSAELAGLRSGSGPESVALYEGTGAGFDPLLWRSGASFLRAFGSTQRFTSLTLDAVAKPHVIEAMTGRPDLSPQPAADATLLLIIGSNPVVSHGHTQAMADPVRRLREAAGRGEVWVVDPRATETAQLATAHLAARPGTDHVLLGFAVRSVLRTGDVMHLGAARADTLRRLLDPLTRDVTAAACDLDPELLDRFAEAIRRHGRLAFVSGTGSTMSRTGNLSEWMLWLLGVVTDSFDAPGGMWFHPGFLRPLPLGRRTSVVLDRATDPVGDASVPGVRVGDSTAPSTSRWDQLPSATLIQRIEAGDVRALLVLGGNPLLALPDTRRTMTALRSLRVLAVADIARSPLTDAATHLMPCPTQLERPDVSLAAELAQPKVVARFTDSLRSRPAGVRSGWWWIAALADRLGLHVLPRGVTLRSTDEEHLGAVCASFEELHAAGSPIVRPLPEPGRVTDPRCWDLAPAVLVDQWIDWWRERDHGVSPGGLVVIPARRRGRINSVAIAPEAAVFAFGVSAAVAERLGRSRTADVAPAGIRDADPIGLRGVVTVQAGMRDDVISVPHGETGCSVNVLTRVVGLDPRTGMPQYSGMPVTLRPSRQRTTQPNN